MNYSASDLISALSGGVTFREKALPEAKDFTTWLSSAYTPTQASIMSGLLDFTKDQLLAKALTDRAIMSGKRYG
jgi:hypothetical protein